MRYTTVAQPATNSTNSYSNTDHGQIKRCLSFLILQRWISTMC